MRWRQFSDRVISLEYCGGICWHLLCKKLLGTCFAQRAKALCPFMDWAGRLILGWDEWVVGPSWSYTAQHPVACEEAYHRLAVEVGTWLPSKGLNLLGSRRALTDFLAYFRDEFVAIRHRRICGRVAAVTSRECRPQQDSFISGA